MASYTATLGFNQLTDLSPNVGTNQSLFDEPSVAANGNLVFEAGNWFAAGNNTMRLAIASGPANLANGNWYYYDVTPQQLGLAASSGTPPTYDWYSSAGTTNFNVTPAQGAGTTIYWRRTIAIARCESATGPKGKPRHSSALAM